MEKNEAKVRAGQMGALKRWGHAGGDTTTVSRKIFKGDADFVANMGMASTATAVHALVEFYKANQTRKKGRVKKPD